MLRSFAGSHVNTCSIPGIGTTGVAIRHGCVMISINMLDWARARGEEGPEGANATDTYVQALARALAQCQADRHMDKGSGLRAQVGTYMCVWRGVHHMLEPVWVLKHATRGLSV